MTSLVLNNRALEFKVLVEGSLSLLVNIFQKNTDVPSHLTGIAW